MGVRARFVDIATSIEDPFFVLGRVERKSWFAGTRRHRLLDLPYRNKRENT
jgi:hypothetical protein